MPKMVRLRCGSKWISGLETAPAAAVLLAVECHLVLLSKLKIAGSLTLNPVPLLGSRPLGRRLKQIVKVFDHGANYIGAADNANQHAVTQDRDALDPMFQH